MRSFIFSILILMAVPAHGLGQQRDRPGRVATGRTAIPREADQAAPAGQGDRRTEPRGETRAPSTREDTSDPAAPPREGRVYAPSAGEMVRGRMRGQLPQAVPARPWWINSPRIPEAQPTWHTPGIRQRVNREHWRPAQLHKDYRSHYQRPHSGANVVFVPYPAPVTIEREVLIERNDTVPAPVIVEQPLVARLILDVHPATAQIFADGYYIGIPEDFRFENGGAVLEPGPHRIDIVAHDYESVSFDVNLTRGQSATFRHSLAPVRRQPQPAPDAAAKPPAVRQPVTFYLIPGCYMGNVPPKEANLPATCDIARAKSFQY